MNIWRWLSDLPLTDPVERKLAPLLQLMLIGIGIALGIAFAVRLMQNELPPDGAAIAAIFELVLLVILIIIRRGNFQVAAWLLITVLFLASVRRLGNAEGIDTGENAMGLYLPLVIAALMGSRRMLVLLFVATCMLLVFTTRNLEPREAVDYTVTSFFLNAALMCFLLDLIGSTLRSELKNSTLRNAELEQARKSLAVTLQSIGDAVIATDVQGKINFINPVAQKLTGWTEAQAAGQLLPDVFRIINETSRQTVESPVDKVIREGVIVGLANHTLLITREGHEIPIDDSGAPIRDAEGKLIGVILVFRDINERKHAEKRIELLLELSSAFSQAATREKVAEVVVEHALKALEGSIATVCLLTPDGSQLEILNRYGLSEELYQKYRYTPIEFNGPLNEAVHQRKVVWMQNFEEYVAHFPHLKGHLEASGNRSTVCLPLLANDKVRGGISFSFTRAYNRNEIDESFFNVLAQQCAQALERAALYETETQARYEAEEANQLKIRFLGMISHELRTPLTSIKGFASSLLAKDVKWNEEDQRNFITILDSEADKLKWLVEQLLDISALQGGTLAIHPERQTLQSVIEVAFPQLQVLTTRHTLVMELPKNLPDVMADKNRISQVLVNLVQNATKFSPAGTAITISASVGEGEVQVNVSDQGPGIPVEAREYVFEAFRQAENKTLWQKGAGLGLAICKGLIKGHGGRIWIAENGAVGTTVSFTLPCA